MEILEKNRMYVSIGEVSRHRKPPLRLRYSDAAGEAAEKKLVHCRLGQNGFDMIYFLFRCLCSRDIVTFLACDFIQFLL